MTDTLEVINFIDATGGLNVRRQALQLADNESPSMLNMNVDPSGGFFTRKGWTRWNATNIIANPTGIEFTPRAAEIHSLSTGTFRLYVTSLGKIYWSDQTASFQVLSDGASDVPCSADPHLADFGPWADDIYIASGREEPNAWKHPITGTDAVALGFAYNDDYTVPTGGNMPRCEHVEPHGGHMFVANLKEGSTTEHHRLRWSHPNQPEDWANLDFIDINIGGGEITGLKSFYDHLLIFKTDSLWALYGYDTDSWQLIQLSRAVGCPSPQAITRSESACYFFSAADRGGIYGYSGEGAPVHMTEPLRPAFELISPADYTDVFCGWMGKKLWVSLPASYDDPVSRDVLVLDPEVGPGAWVRHRPARGYIGPILTGSDIEANDSLLVLSATDASAVMKVEARDAAYDSIAESYPYPFVVLLAVEDGEAFNTSYRTRWFYNGWPERRKSWRRPRYLVRKPIQDSEVKIELFRDYDQGAPVRQGVVIMNVQSGLAYWRDTGAAAPEGDGFDWDDGTDWSGAPSGSFLIRGPSFGHSRAIQLVFSNTDNLDVAGTAWGIDGCFLKVIMREFTT